jgi:hypothetical protein
VGFGGGLHPGSSPLGVPLLHPSLLQERRKSSLYGCHYWNFMGRNMVWTVKLLTKFRRILLPPSSGGYTDEPEEGPYRFPPCLQQDNRQWLKLCHDRYLPNPCHVISLAFNYWTLESELEYLSKLQRKGRSQWPRGLRRGSAAERLLGL